jgi:hypothetical protein
MQLAPREKTATQRPTTNAPVNIAVYKVTDCAGDLWGNFKDVQTKLWQVQIDHDARPSVTVRMYDSFNEFLKDHARNSPGSTVESTKQLESDAGIKLVMTNQDDPDGLGCFKQYRVAWYVAGEIDQVINFFNLLDNYLLHKAKQFARATPFEVNIYPYTDVDLESLPDQMSHKPIKVHPCGRDLPLKLFEAHPVVGKKVLTLNFETEATTELSLVITGNTWISERFKYPQPPPDSFFPKKNTTGGAGYLKCPHPSALNIHNHRPICFFIFQRRTRAVVLDI